MRSHLYNIFERKTLIHFPTVKNENLNKHLLFTSTPTVFNEKQQLLLETLNKIVIQLLKLIIKSIILKSML